MNKWAELLFGLIILVGVVSVAGFSSVYEWSLFGKNLNFLHAGWEFFKGGLFWVVTLIGLGLIFLGMNDLRE